ncbi:hypothetical protein DFJ68_1774 [Terracoccus luteus]|uniref:Amidohydrolase 3 domain-containing protein n=1 Tax=Terracoccus luteus TaxID=53356 RepID=A0A495XUU9_9MICO|nr:amidohydrolase [Terracoccus luteus]RKT78330.1 hypothetical protein DFJ68_1774 [Terracoccus luteus]
MSRTLLRHPNIRTGSTGSSGGHAPVTTALLVEDGVVVALGDEALAAGRSGGADAVVDLPGEAVLPGLHDAHIHTEWRSRDLSSVDLREARSLEEALSLVASHTATLGPDEWLHSGRWNHNRWTVPVQPDRRSLDRVAPDRVAALSSVDGHTVWANSLALRLAGITRETPDPVGGEIVRDADGEPTGILRESAQDLLDVVPQAKAPLRPLLERNHDELLALGLTSITDIDGEECRDAYVAMHADGRLRLRVAKCVRGDDLEVAVADGRRSGQGDGVLSVGPVKFFSDGALGSHTAHMTEPFLGHEGCGIAAMPYPVLLQRIRRSLAHGFDIATHAIGDEANRLVLDAFATVRAEGHTGILRVEHAQHLLAADVPRFRELDVVASMQPSHCTADLELADEIIGYRPLHSYAWRTLLDAGARLAFGSDAPVEDPNPFHALHAAVTRQRADGLPPGGWRPHERITLDEALHAHTVGAHEAVGRHDVGRLVPGQLADLVAVDRDPWSVDPADIRDTVVLQTVVGGETVFTR